MKLLNDLIFINKFFSIIKFVVYNGEKYRILDWNEHDVAFITNNNQVGYTKVDNPMLKFYVDETCFGKNLYNYLLTYDDYLDNINNIKRIKNPLVIDNYVNNESIYNIKKYKNIFKVNFYTDEVLKTIEYDHIFEYFQTIFDGNNYSKLPNKVLKFFLDKNNKNKTVCLYQNLSKRRKFINVMEEEFEVDEHKNLVISDNKEELIEHLFYAKLQDTIDKQIVIYNMDDNCKINGENF